VAVAQAKVDPGVRFINADEPVVIAQDKALAVLRIQSPWSMMSAFLMRIPSAEELSAYETAKRGAYDKAGKKAGAYESFVFDYQGVANFYEFPVKKAMMRGAVALVVAELPPGDYILYGEGYSGFLYECMCFGTVGFSLRAGQATDLGTFLVDKAWEQSAVPELTEVSGLGRIGRMDYGLAPGPTRRHRRAGARCGEDRTGTVSCYRAIYRDQYAAGYEAGAGGGRAEI
jgi:hypothetical protein